MRALRIVALLAGLAVASAANSDICEDGTEYDGSAEFTPGGATCGGSDTSGCVSKSDGLYWSCDYMLTTLTGYMNVHFTDGSTRLFVGDAWSTGPVSQGGRSSGRSFARPKMMAPTARTHSR